MPASDGTVSGLSAYDDSDSDDDRDEDERQAGDLQADRCVQCGWSGAALMMSASRRRPLHPARCRYCRQRASFADL